VTERTAFLLIPAVLLSLQACASSGGPGPVTSAAPAGTSAPAPPPQAKHVETGSRSKQAQKNGEDQPPAPPDEPALPRHDSPRETAPPSGTRETTPDRGREALPEDVQKVKDGMDEAYQDGLEAYQAGRFQEAKEGFDRAVDIVLSSGLTLDQYPGLRAAFDDMVADISDLDADLYRQDSPPDSGENASPLDSLKDITTFLSPEEAEREREKIQKVVGAISYDIPITLNPKVLGFIEAFQTRIRREFEAGLQRSGAFLPMIKAIFREEGLPEDLAYMAHQESAFKSSAYSRARAKGMWQFMSFTGKKYGLRIDPWVDERSDFEKATRAAARYLKDLHERYDDWYLAMAAYNAGEGKIDRAIARARTRDFWAICKTKYIRAETKSYVPAILASILIDKSPEDYGFNVDLDPQLQWERVEIEQPTDLQVIAEGCSGELEKIRFLNPELRGLVTPPNVGTYSARVPVGKKEAVLAHLTTVPAEKRVSWTVHEVRNGETFTTVARRYKVPVRTLVEANPRYAGKRLRHGTLLNVPLVAGVPVQTAAATDRPTYESGERVVHRVRKGDTLQAVAGQYRTTVANLKRWNRLGNSVIHPGQRLVAYYGEKGDGPNLDVDPSTPAQVAGGRLEYRVQQGDTLNSISRKFSASLPDLLRWNNMDSASVIHPGDRLWVGEPSPANATQGVSERGAASAGGDTTIASAAAPPSASVAPSPATGSSTVTYKVRKGDTLHSIARLYDVTVSQVRSWNGLNESGVIIPGQVLRIQR
jgi:membrane-bound lytic murein transglycosylase D